MICDPCKEGGNALRDWLDKGRDISESLRQAISVFHRNCTNPSCTCQHKIEKAIRR